MTEDRGNLRILDIDFTTDNSDNDIEDVISVTFYRNAQSRTAGNGFAVDFKCSAGEGGTLSAPEASLGTNEAWIWFSEQIPRIGVIVLDQATQA